MRNAAVFEQADDRRQTNRETRRVQEVSVLFFGHGHTLEHEYDGAARGADIDRLVGGVQHQYRSVQCVAIASGASSSSSSSTRATSSFRVRATIATQTLAAPARRKIRAHSEAVVPVVNTSSTNRTTLPARSCPLVTAKAPRMLSRRSGPLNPVCDLVSRFRWRRSARKT